VVEISTRTRQLNFERMMSPDIRHPPKILKHLAAFTGEFKHGVTYETAVYTVALLMFEQAMYPVALLLLMRIRLCILFRITQGTRESFVAWLV
jgi:hypothetical protein